MVSPNCLPKGFPNFVLEANTNSLHLHQLANLEWTDSVKDAGAGQAEIPAGLRQVQHSISRV